ncbi:DUF4936 family protein [Herbaspirillum autotrophicum]|uniref:DUF4936 family protein n=1 Tax=Herbaspirillum autotrophicum TaxID=180195 RepID=UPI00067D91F4|nr:DUF4936 family protein [Herbaspirillum autotrophicum]
MDLYIYYRVCGAQADALQQQVGRMQATLSQAYKVATGLKRRPEEKDGCHTWMEVYLDTPEQFEIALQQHVLAADLAALIDGPRHIERFLDVSPCA